MERSEIHMGLILHRAYYDKVSFELNGKTSHDIAANSAYENGFLAVERHDFGRPCNGLTLRGTITPKGIREMKRLMRL